VTTLVTPRNARRARGYAAPARRRKPVVSDRAIRQYQPVATMPSTARFATVAGALCLVLAVVVAKLVLVQGVQHDRFEALSVGQTRHTFKLAATRGSILDRNGRDLALSINKKTIYADPSMVEDPLGAAKALAPILHMSVREVQTKLTGSGRFVYLARKVDDGVAKQVADLHLLGVASTNEAARMRPANDLAANLIGQVGLDNEGLGGLEHQYEADLKGKPGSISVDADRHLNRIASGDAQVQPSVAGDDIVLTIDQGLQYEAERLLSAQIAATRAKGGLAVVMNTTTGDVLAMANLTATKPGGPVVQSARNTTVTDVFEPGSVNKLITMAGALEDNSVHVADRMLVPDRLKVGNHVFTDHDPHAPTTWGPTDIMRESSNIGTIMIAQKLGKERLANYLNDFGFGTKTGIGFPGETAGLLRPVAKWYSTDIGSISIGQGVSVSALQMLAAYNAVANGGKYVAPRLVRATIDDNGVEHAAAPARTRRAVSVPTATAVTAMLEEVVKSGTGTLAQIPGYRVAGKTGTARKPAAGGTGYIDGAYVSSFAGFAPADHPQITAMVMLDEPTPIFGGLVAAPVFSELARAVLRAMRVPPSIDAMAVTPPQASVTEQVVRGDGDAPAVPSTTSSTAAVSCCSQR
jgi:cell division protein FtsI (penicillin-binding protein 3)